MANKFQKSVQERLSQEISHEKKLAPERKDTGLKGEKKSELTAEEKFSQKINVSNQYPTKPSSPQIDISAYLRRDTQRIAKNKTFYLDSDLVDAIKITSKQQGITESRLVNDILRNILGLK